MKAIVQHEYGPPDVLRLEEVTRPEPGDGEVLIKVQAASVSAAVWHIMAGEPYLMRIIGFGLSKPNQRIAGQDLAGTIEQVGNGVSDVAPGAEVFGMGRGAFAEYALARPDQLALKPTNLTFEQAAAVPDSGCTALRAVREDADVKPGQRVLVIGAGGGVGSFAVQIAKADGAEVTGVCSTSKVETVRSLGADRVIDYKNEDFADGRRSYDVMIDTAGRRPLPQLRRALSPDGTLVIVGGEGGGRWFGGISRQLAAVVQSRFIGQMLRAPVYTEHRSEHLQQLKELIEAGKVTPLVTKTHPLDETPDAVRAWAQGHASGKIVITV